MNLEKLFNPKSVAVIGASRSPASVGQGILRNLALGCVYRCEYCRPFPGRIFPVNPFADRILGMQCYKSVLDIPEDVDLAVISIPSVLVLPAVKECVRKKVKAVIIVSSGFSEAGESGRQLQDNIVALLGKHGIPLLGPNCLGVIHTPSSLNASFAPSTPPKGDIAFVSQSGALVDSIIDWAIENRYGFSSIVSYGNKAMLDCPDFLEHLSSDESTKAIALYIEGLNDGRRFIEVASKVSRSKPIVAVKGGATPSGVSAVSSHTASLAGDYRVYTAAFRQSGVIQAATVEEMFDVAKALSEQKPCENKIAVVTNGGGCGVLCADYCEQLGVNLVELKPSTISRLERSGVMHHAYSRRNPLDIVGDATVERYEAAVSTLLSEKYVSGLIVIQTLQTMTQPVENARVIVEAHKKHPEKPIICCFMGGRFSRNAIRHLESMHIPDYNDVRKAVVAMKALVSRNEFLSSLKNKRL